jgi:prepilin-type processing-associated H-X9-DG protein
MDCDRWREAISAWLDGEVTTQEEKEVQEHLSACPACRDWLAQVEADQQSFVQSLMGRQADISEAVMRRVSEMSVEAKEVAVPQRRPSFTIVELLVVVAVMGVLAAIMFPVFAKAREKARQSSCLSNIKQLALATLAYAQDWDEVLPPAENWAEAILPYTKNTQLLLCPTDQTGEKISYAMVSRLGGRKLADIPDPQHTILIYEVEHGQPVYRHNDGMNVGYVDGHAKWVQKGKLPADFAPNTAISPAAPDHNYGLRRSLQLAYDASCEIWVQQIQQAVVSAEKVFYERGGFVLKSTLSQPLDDKSCRSAQIEGKVPTAEVGAVMNALGSLGYVVQREIAGADLTDQYVTQSRAVTGSQENLAQVERRRAAAPASRRPVLQQKAREAREQLGQAQDAIFGVQREVALATISATLIERAPQAAVSAGQIGRAWQGFTRTATKLGIALVWIGLYGLFLVPIVVGVAIVRRRRRA